MTDASPPPAAGGVLPDAAQGANAGRRAAPYVVVVGGGPSGLMAAQVLSAGGVHVDLYDAMPSCGRKFLLAGRGGLNLTHGEPMERFLGRYGAARPVLEPWLRGFGPGQVRQWAAALGVDTFVGSSGRVFPRDMKAAPLLRSWLHALRGAGVVFHMRHRWIGWADAGDAGDAGDAAGRVDAGGGVWLRFQTPQGERRVRADAVVLALGGGSWPHLGSDGAWQPWLSARGVRVAPLAPSNCGFDVGRRDAHGHELAGWSEHFRQRFAGQPVKTVTLSLAATGGGAFSQLGEFVITETGVEGSLVYAASALARGTIERGQPQWVQLDLLPARSAEFVRAEVLRPRGARSLSTHLKSRLGLDGVKAALLRELAGPQIWADPTRLAAAIKALPLCWVRARPLAEAISSAGGVGLDALDERLMLRAVPGVFCAGEMLDWEAPTGGYLLTASLASGAAAAQGVIGHLGLSVG